MLILNSVNHKKLKNAITSLLLITLIITPLLSLIKIQPVFAAETVLTPKWTRSGLGTNWEGGLVIGDVTGDGFEEVVYAGGTSVYVLNGTNGATIASYSNSRIYRYCQPQLYDVDGDGILDILVPLYYLPGLAVIQYDGDSTLSALWVQNVQGTSGSGSCMSKPVAGDIDGDGDLEIYIATQDVAPAGGYDGTVTMLDHQGNILAQTFSWRSCSGGLSLADTDNDGEFELYMGDRGIYYGDGNYGKGTRSFWARNLTERWNRLDFLSSSQAPVLIDVNGDGILEVLAGMYREMNILNSTNGATIRRWANSAMSVHYGITVYDIDGDGHLELLCNDGDHDDDPYTDVFDLVTGNLEAELSLAGGDSKWSPLVADISPTQPGMEIISVPNGTSLSPSYWNGAIMIYNRNYESIQNVTRDSNNARLGSQLGYPVVQDIDGDKLLEFVTHASSGTVYAYDTVAPAPGYSSSLPGSQRIRSEVTFFGEKRTGVAQYQIPTWGENYWTAPVIAPLSPANDALGVPVTTSQLSFRMREHQGQNVSYTVTTSPNIGGGSGSSVGNPYNWNTYTINLNPGSLNYDTAYTWKVTASDGTNAIVKTYSFRTALAPAVGNNPPTQANPTLIPTDGLGTTTSTFVCSNQTTTDPNGNKVTNTYRWMVNGNPVANLQLPFNIRNETSTKDYAYGNNGIVKGAVWTPNGIVGGAYSFDGQDDAIIISDGGLGYYNNRSYATNQPELGGDGTWTEATVEAWIYLKEYNNGSRIVAKLPSYEIGFQSGYTNRLMASVWPKTGQISDDDNAASTDRAQTVTATVSIQLNTWYHIAFTYKSGDGLKLYFNGVQVAQRTGVVGPLEDSLGEPLYIGRLAQPFNGLIDEVQMYPYAQSAQQINNSYQQSKDGSSSSSMFIPVGAASPGDNLTCQVIPTDSFVEGNMASASFALLNSPPTASNLIIYPVRDRAFRLDNENLFAGYDYFDADGNLESGSQIGWYMNGALQSSFNDQLQIPAVNTSIGQTWYFTVTPRDSGGAIGDLQTSYTITIRNNTIPSTGVPLLDSSDGGADFDDEDLIGSAVGTSDANGDSTTNIYRWTKQGVSMTNLQMPFDTEVPRYINANATTRDYSGYGNNGVVVGASWVQDGVVGGALSFDGNDFIRVQEHSGSLGGNGSWSKASVEFWVKATGVTNAESVVLKHNANFATGGSSGSSYGVGYRADFRSYVDRDRFYWYVYNSTGVASVEFSDYTNFGLWHHVVCTYESGVGLKLYVDGMVRASTAFTGNINATLDGLLDIGGYSSGTADFSGLLDEVRIYPNALSAAQVFQRYIETKDGQSNSNLIVAQATSAGDDWVCQVIPNDSWEDGAAVNSLSLHVDAVTGNSRPRIDWYSPVDLTQDITEGNSIVFMQVSSDPNGNPLSYSWKLDSVQQATTQNWTYTPGNASQGTHKVRVTVSDGNLSDYQEWDVKVGDTTPPQWYNLTITTSNNGNTNPIAGVYSYLENSQASIQAIPNANYELSYWLRNNTNVGNANPYILTMNATYNLTAVFRIIQYQLHVQVSGSGTTNATGDNLYDAGTSVAIQAIPAFGWQFSHWLLNNVNVGSANPYVLAMNNNYNCTSVFTVIPQPDDIFWDDFESASFSKWNGTSITSGENTTIATLPHHGSYSARFTTNGGGGTERAYAYVNFTGQTELYVRGYFNIQAGLPLQVNDDRFNLFALQNASTTIVSAGVRRNGGVDLWSITGTAGAWYASTGPSMNQWYCVELYIRIGSSPNGTLSMWINGQPVINQTGLNMALPVSIVQLRAGLVYANNILTTLDVYGDCLVVSNEPIGPEQDQVQRHLNISTIGNGTTDPTPGVYEYSDGEGVSVQAIAGSGWVLSHWLLNGANVGSANPYVLNMNADYNLTAVFAEVPPVQYRLHVEVTGSGSTNTSGDHLYNPGTIVNIQATADPNWVFSYWLLNNTNVGSSNPYLLNMSANYNLTAVFQPIQYQLHVGMSGLGTTNATGDTWYAYGTNVSVQATAADGWEFKYWLLNGVNVGSANPYTLTMDANYNLTAIFIPQEYTLTMNINGGGSVTKSPNQATYQYGTNVTLTAASNSDWIFAGWSGDASGSELVITINNMTSNKVITATFVSNTPQPSIFEDDFESASFSKWSSTTRTTGETTSIATNIVHFGSNSANFTSNGDGGYERAYASRSGLSLSELYARAYVYVDQSGIVENGDRFYFIQMMSGSNILAYAGWRQDTSGNLRWHIMIRDGTNTVGAYSTVSPVSDTWYCVELHWKADPTAGLGELYVNGEMVASITNRNTANYGNATIARLGLPEIYNCAGTIAYIDDVAIGTSYIGPKQELEEYVFLTIGSSNGGSTNPSAGIHRFDKNTAVSITATPDSGYTLSGWLLNGVSVGNTSPYILTMNANYSLTPLFAEIRQYQLHVVTSGSGTTNATGTNIYTEDSNVAVMATASSNWKLDHWLLNGTNVGSANPYTIHMDANYDLTAVFIENPPQYQLHVQVSGSGTTNATGNTLYDYGTSVSVQATPTDGWEFSYWLLNDTNVGSANPYLLTMNANYNLTAVFVPQEYTLTVNTIGDGSVTRSPNQATYQYGTNASLIAAANSGWIFTGWSGDASGTEPVITINMTGNKVITAVFIEEQPEPPSDIIFADGFESGSFSAWTSTSSTSGETVSISTNPVYSGNYAGSFGSNGGGSYEKAYATKTLTPSLGEIYVQCNFRLSQNGMVENGDRIKLIELRSGSTIIAAAGLTQRSGTTRWWLETRDGTTYVETYAQATTNISDWFTIELQWLNNASAGRGSLWVNGTPIIQVSNDNTSNYGNCTEARIGLPEIYNCGATTLYVDDAIIATAYIGL